MRNGKRKVIKQDGDVIRGVSNYAKKFPLELEPIISAMNDLWLERYRENGPEDVIVQCIGKMLCIAYKFKFVKKNSRKEPQNESLG